MDLRICGRGGSGRIRRRRKLRSVKNSVTGDHVGYETDPGGFGTAATGTADCCIVWEKNVNLTNKRRCQWKKHNNLQFFLFPVLIPFLYITRLRFSSAMLELFLLAWVNRHGLQLLSRCWLSRITGGHTEYMCTLTLDATKVSPLPDMLSSKIWN
jgi:hypothetical protein